MFTMPVHFDENEWFILIVLSLLVVVFWLMPRKMPISLSILIMLFFAFLGRIADFVLAFEYPLNFYDTMDTKNYDLFDFITYSIIYPLYGYFFADLYYRWNLKGLYRIYYIIGWIFLSLFFEHIASLLNVFHYNRWNMFSSFLAYIVTFLIVIFFLEQIKKWYNREVGKFKDV
ncbi:hypothetical protein [Metabacillus arenae]|uniref:Uncharacterized protein n=1 Tax=Metabacillus arenae TaxID=2771434 RepID=A0A926NBZ1_9BACI|nr:hypothetical protein [Metabacillus arenae]MBD1380714.1 hypothetical protein [Metabacillus arenae]